eukprot:c19827_g1_i1.p1 GENE.c19827_g1_i1~~c19827_g1_i1.p1  ORF type:complete len:331 (-),score=128.02 c19827_g1_i1:107-1099(-)
MSTLIPERQLEQQEQEQKNKKKRKKNKTMSVCTSRVLLVTPNEFRFNEATASDNAMMNKIDGSPSEIATAAAKEHQNLVVALQSSGVDVDLFEASPETPDACYVNNWFSTHHDSIEKGKSLILYPLKAPNRRLERREDIIKKLKEIYPSVCDFSEYEKQEKYLESTGSLILDRKNKKAYVGLSLRADTEVLNKFCEETGYEAVSFHTQDRNGDPIYHTNVLLTIGRTFAILCTDAIVQTDRERVVKSLEETHKVIHISFDQMDRFCANSIELSTKEGKSILVMSTNAYEGFNEDQRTELQKHVDSIVHVPLPTLEKVGGGGVRCCIAELF